MTARPSPVNHANTGGFRSGDSRCRLLRVFPRTSRNPAVLHRSGRFLFSILDAESGKPMYVLLLSLALLLLPA
ncbi:MAG TPA: hypothetical protein DC058_20740 [Planctomycetaceae bacterium]|nr:hypothetical protein [Planctomycetaceae bacterium]